MSDVVAGRLFKTLHVFISSPGDCAPERTRVEEVLARVNESFEARQARIVLKPLRWENLPPGETKAGDYQGLIDDLLKRVGLDRFDIYVGFVRERVGSATRGHPSGTICEFETALSQRRKTGMPAEVLFYFLKRPEGALAAFRDSLADRGFLYSDVDDAVQFEARLTEHLLHVVKGWWRWRNRVRRRLRELRMIAAGVAVIAATALAIAEISTAREIQGAAHRGDAALVVKVWRDRGQYLPFVRMNSGHHIDQALVSIAADRLMQALIAQNIDPFTWTTQHLRPFEVHALERHARGRLASDPTLMMEPDRAMRLAVATLAQDWALMARLATEMAYAGRDNDPPEVSGFAMHAPASHVTAWIDQLNGDDLPPFIAARILEALARRADDAATFPTLDALRAGRLGADARGFDLRLGCNAEHCVEDSRLLLERWLGPGGAPPAPALALLLSWAAPTQLPQQIRDKIAPPLVHLLADERYAEISTELIDFLGKSGSPHAAQALRKLLDDHLEGRIYYGFSDRQALLNVLEALVPNRRADTALQIARLSKDEVALSQNEPYGPNDGGVQAAYVEVLSRSEQRSPTHLRWVLEQIERRLSGQFGITYASEFDRAVGALLPALDDSEFVVLFGETEQPVVDSWDGKLSGRRAWLLDQLPAEGVSPLAEAIVTRIWHSIPVRQAHRAAFYRALALHGGAPGRACLRQQLSFDPEAAAYLGLAGDLETMLARVGTTGPSEVHALEALLQAAADLDTPQRQAFIAAAVKSAPPTAMPLLWGAATGASVADPALIESAVRALARADSVPTTAAAVQFLQGADAARVWKALEEQDVQTRWMSLLSSGDAFDWITLTQSLPVPSGPTDFLERMFNERRFLLVLDADQVTATSALDDRFMRARSSTLSNPLARLIVLGAPADRSVSLLHAARDAAGPVKLLGTAPAPTALFRAYCNWLLAEAISMLPNSRRRSIPRDELSAWVDDSDAVGTRAAAGLVLAVLGGT